APTTDVINNASLSFIFTGSGLTSSTDPIITTWSSLAPIGTISINPASSSTELRTDSFEVGSILTISNGTLLINAGQEITGATSSITVNAGTTLSVQGYVRGTSGTATSEMNAITINGTTTVGSAGYLNVDNVTINSGGTLNIGTTQPNGWWYQTTAPANASFNLNSTVNYSTAGNQGVAARTYGNLSVTSQGTTATKTLSSDGTLTVAGTLTIGSSTTFTSSNTNVINLNGNISNSGIWSTSQDVNFAGTSQTVSGNAITFGGAVDIASTVAFNNSVTFGSTLNVNSNNVSFGGATTTFNGAVSGLNTLLFTRNSNQTLAGTASLALPNLTVNTTGTLTNSSAGINLSGTLTVGNSATFNTGGASRFTLVSTSGTSNARVASLSGGGSVIGNVTYQRFFNGQGDYWRNFGLPVNGAVVSNITGSGFTIKGNDLAYYNESEITFGTIDDGWVLQSTFGTNLSATRGYSMWTRTEQMPRVVNFTGALNTGTQNMTVTRTSTGNTANDGWNLVNNPYASTVDWDLFTKSALVNTVYVWNGSSYDTWNGSTGTLAGGLIANGQAFWVHSTSGSPSLTITEDDKVSSATSFLRTEENPLVDHMKIDLSNAEYSDATFVHFRAEATDVFDEQYDGYKLKGSYLNISSVISTGEDLAINSMSSINEVDITNIDLNIGDATPGVYTLTFDGYASFTTISGIILMDNFENKQIDLGSVSSYMFNVTEDANSKGAGRFDLIFNSNRIAGVEEHKLSESLKVYPNPVQDILTIETKAGDNEDVSILIWNMQGQKMVEGVYNPVGNNVQIDVSTFNKGIYYLNVTDKTGTLQSKIVKN
ncbi:MAG: T9SS type A sorting domain-containing protein, partial [Cyclobacteriaceae bacterium]|nr:T9SS type A sorting domain-containing protein [Cyclobacteriaceae bacterium]